MRLRVEEQLLLIIHEALDGEERSARDDFILDEISIRHRFLNIQIHIFF